MSFYQKCSVLKDCTVEGVTVKLGRIQFEIGKGWSCMFPVNEVHDIAECTYHTVASSRNLFSFFVHQVVRICSFCGGFFFFVLTETIAEPSHNKTRFECKCFILPYTRYCVTVYTDTTLRICCSTGGIEFILPETSAKYSSLIWLGSTDTDGAKLAVTAANNNRSAFLQSGIGSTFCADFCNDGSWLSYRWENISAKTAFFSDTRIPLAALKIKDTSGRSITWFNCFNTSQFAD